MPPIERLNIFNLNVLRRIVNRSCSTTSFSSSSSSSSNDLTLSADCISRLNLDLTVCVKVERYQGKKLIVLDNTSMFNSNSVKMYTISTARDVCNVLFRERDQFKFAAVLPYRDYLYSMIPAKFYRPFWCTVPLQYVYKWLITQAIANRVTTNA